MSSIARKKRAVSSFGRDWFAAVISSLSSRIGDDDREFSLLLVVTPPNLSHKKRLCWLIIRRKFKIIRKNVWQKTTKKEENKEYTKIFVLLKLTSTSKLCYYINSNRFLRFNWVSSLLASLVLWGFVAAVLIDDENHTNPKLRLSLAVGEGGSRSTSRGCTSWPKMFGSYLCSGFCLRSTRTSSWAETTINLNFQISPGFPCFSPAVSGSASTITESPNQSITTVNRLIYKVFQWQMMIKKPNKLSFKRSFTGAFTAGFLTLSLRWRSASPAIDKVCQWPCVTPFTRWLVITREVSLVI